MTHAAPFKSRETVLADPSIWVGAGFMDLLDPNPLEINPHDIARALSRLCRWGGHCRRFYSVAEHSVNVMRLAQRDRLPIEAQRLALMHDATEAYLGDVVSPLKACLPEYQRIEARMAQAIAARFALPDDAETVAAIKRLDLEMLAIEKAAILPGSGIWPGLPKLRRSRSFYAVGLSPETAERLMLENMAALGLG